MYAPILPAETDFADRIHVAEEVCFPVAHRQVVLTIPKRLRLHTRFDRKLLGKLSSCAWTCLKAEAERMLGREDVVPGMIAAIQTHGELLHWHPHIHVLVTCGAFTPEGDFVELPEFDIETVFKTIKSELGVADQFPNPAPSRKSHWPSYRWIVQFPAAAFRTRLQIADRIRSRDGNNSLNVSPLKPDKSKMKFQDLKIKTKIVLAICPPMVLMLILAGVVVHSIGSIVETDKAVDHTHEVLSGATDIIRSAVDMETGMRGYLLAGKEGFLAPYYAGEERSYVGIAALQKTVNDNPKQVERLDEVRAILKEWQKNVTEMTIDLRRKIGNAETMNDMAQLVGEAKGKEYFDRFRGQIATFIEQELKLLEIRRIQSTMHMN